MIEYVHHRLCRWALWVSRGNRVHGLGYPGSVAFVRLTPRGGPRQDVDFNDDAFEIDLAVSQMQRDASEFVRMFYLEPGSVASKAAAMQVHRDTLYARLHQSHVHLMEWLQDHDDEYVRQAKTFHA